MQLTTPASDLAARIGADRVVEPPGALPQPAERVDPRGPVRPYEIAVAVERLCLDSTSHRNLRERADGDAARMAALMLDIVAARGKMHNPETGSGGVLVGTVAAVGSAYEGTAAVGDRIVTLASLTLTPLQLTGIIRLDPESAQVDVTGTAYLPQSAPWGPLPDDLPLDLALAVYDVYACGSHTRDLAAGAASVCVLGAGHAGKLALAAARDANPAAKLYAIDADPTAVDRVRELCDTAVVADLRDPLAAAAAVPQCDLVVHVTSARGCEPAAILLTADRGTLLLYSMATNFQTTALTADGLSRDIQLFIGNGFAPDRGAYALGLVRSNPAYRRAM